MHCIFKKTIKKIKRNQRIHEKEAPAPILFPFIGIIGVYQINQLHLAFRYYVKTYGKGAKVVRALIFDQYSILIANPKILKEVYSLKNAEYFDARPSSTRHLLLHASENSLIMSYDSKWRDSRKLLSAYFAKTKIKNFTAIGLQTAQLIRKLNQFKNIPVTI
ncbi:hypothetical protein DFA_07608 [Cavenderia fasciculata]|uniref:Cytochrome P450 family protein n=1 Tax=Cavenderia fasciculata TaxID=261658 RepID=F4Q644_CACFS|nr:uncharacterized protein DFA_07608 [Cavenderia fasciculata]EGG16630.1 hypothetical protein DFA_07608 [Cavenderia fasciculata]|eukprot:XP_004355104.1 hypothetical protein DFA_07608 [Cavenderia fasciculata]